MSTSLLVPTTELATDAELELVQELEHCERRMLEAAAQEISASYAIGKELNLIEKRNLYVQRRNCKSFHAYLLLLPWDKAYSYKVQRQAKVFDELIRANLPPPKTATILEELSRLPLDEVAEFWRSLLVVAEEEQTGVRRANVRKAIDNVPKEPEPPVPKRPGVVVNLKDDSQSKDSNGQAAATPTAASAPPVTSTPKKTFQDEGEEALERIRRLCGDPVADAIIDGRLDIGERALKKWGDEDDDMVKVLAHYVSDLGWSVDKAIRFENKSVNDDLTLSQMITWAMARGGKWVRSYEGFRISVVALPST